MSRAETYVIAVLLPIGIAVGFLGLLRHIDFVLDVILNRGDVPVDDPYELGPPAPGSIDHTLAEIRALPEVPFDWNREQAV